MNFVVCIDVCVRDWQTGGHVAIQSFDSQYNRGDACQSIVINVGGIVNSISISDENPHIIRYKTTFCWLSYLQKSVG
jgi:hypothetical protein